MRNGNRHKLITCFLLAVIMTVSLAGCTTFDSFRHTFIDPASTDAAPVITIGVFEPQTGKNAERGKAEIKGIELANSIYNNVDGYKIVLSKVDTQSKASTAGTAFQGLLEMNPVAVIGSAGEATSLVASEYVEENKIPTITPSATNPLITQTNGFYFRACITGSQMGEGLAEYAYRELKSRKIGIISIKNDTNTAAIIDGFEAKIKKLARKKSKAIVLTSEITDTEEEITEAVKDIRRNACDVCFVSMGTESMDKLFSKVEELNLTDITFLGNRSWGSKDFVAMMGNHPDIKVVFPYSSVMVGDSSSTDNLTEEAQRFQIEYASKYGSDDIPTDSAALGYDSYLILINAIHNAKSLYGTAIRDAMLDLKDLKGVTGVFSFDSNGNVVRTVNLSTIKDGMVVSEYVTMSEAEAKDLEDIESTQNTEDNGHGIS